MIEVKIDLVPFGVENKRRTLKSFIIANDGTGDKLTGNYKVMSSDKKKILAYIKKHDRSQDVLALVNKAISLLKGKSL